MPDQSDDDQLREAAKARGFRLVKSRRRKPGGDFGLYGLVALESGRECLGFSADGLTASAEEVHSYLRGGEVAAWKRSLIGVVAEEPELAQKSEDRENGKKEGPPPAPPRRRGGEEERAGSALPPRRGGEEGARTEKGARTGSPPALAGGAGGSHSSASPMPAAAKPHPAPQQAKPLPTIRDANRRDAAALARLLGVPAATFAERLSAMLRSEEVPIVADRDGPVGILAWSSMPTLQHGLRGRVTLLFVAEDERRHGVGAALLEEAERRLTEVGITRIEMALDIDLDAPTGFLRRTGWERTTNGYGKDVES